MPKYIAAETSMTPATTSLLVIFLTREPMLTAMPAVNCASYLNLLIFLPFVSNEIIEIFIYEFCAPEGIQRLIKVWEGLKWF